MNILPYLICPEQTAICSNYLCNESETLRCGCGKTYKKIEGIPALRQIDSQDGCYEEQLPPNNRYYIETFVGMFFLRQYGRLVCVNETPRIKFDERMFSRIAEIYDGSEVFYQTLLSMAMPHLKSETLALDIGCGLGRLTGELAKKGVKAAIGVDYSPLMIKGATKVVLSEKGKIVNLKVRATRLQLHDATILGWGLKNCAFVIADAQLLPTRKNMFDFISCINLMHRVKNPRKVVQEIGRVIKPHGVLLVSNSYDWTNEYTPPELWFDDFLKQLDPTVWQMENEVDGIPYITGMYNRKLSLTFNHLQVFRKLA